MGVKAQRLSESEIDICEKHWAECYCVLKGGDPHTMFANYLGTTRAEAKRVSFTWLYFNRDTFISRMHLRDCKVMGKLIMEVKSLMRSNGIEMSAYEIREAANSRVDAEEAEKLKLRKENNNVR